MRVVTTVNIPNGDSFGRPVTGSLSIPVLETFDEVTDWIESYWRMFQPGMEFTIKFEESSPGE